MYKNDIIIHFDFTMQSQSHTAARREDYASSTLPLTKREKRCHSLSEPKILGGSPHLLGMVSSRRKSINVPVLSPEHQAYSLLKAHPHLYMHKVPRQEQKKVHSSLIQKFRDRNLPVTPTENTLHLQPSRFPGIRVHTRTESAPEPFPVPWRPSLAAQNQLVPTLSGVHKTSPSSPPEKIFEDCFTRKLLQPTLKEPLVATSISPPSSPHYATQHKVLKMKSKPLKTNSSLSSRADGVQLSKSIDSLNLQSLVPQPSSHTESGTILQQQQHLRKEVVAAKIRYNSESVSQGWASNQNQRQLAEIQAFMKNRPPSVSHDSAPYEIRRLEVGRGAGQIHNPTSPTSVEITHELVTTTTRGVGRGSSGGNFSHLNPNSPTYRGTSPQGTPHQGSSPLELPSLASKAHFRPTIVGMDLEKGVDVNQEGNQQQFNQEYHFHHQFPTHGWERDEPSHQHNQKQHLPSCHSPLRSPKRSTGLLQMSGRLVVPEPSTSMNISGAMQQGIETKLEAITNVQMDEDKACGRNRV